MPPEARQAKGARDRTVKLAELAPAVAKAYEARAGRLEAEGDAALKRATAPKSSAWKQKGQLTLARACFAEARTIRVWLARLALSAPPPPKADPLAAFRRQANGGAGTVEAQDG